MNRSKADRYLKIGLVIAAVVTALIALPMLVFFARLLLAFFFWKA